MSKRYLPGLTSPGSKTRSVLPFESPRTVACPTVAAARTLIRCCGCKPGFERFARTLRRWKGLPVISDSARLVRRICPPPSPNEPSSSSMGVLMLVGERADKKGSGTIPDEGCCPLATIVWTEAPGAGLGDAFRRAIAAGACPAPGGPGRRRGGVASLVRRIVRRTVRLCALALRRFARPGRRAGAGNLADRGPP